MDGAGFMATKANEVLKNAFGGDTGVEYSKEQGITLNVGVMMHPNDTSSFFLKGRMGERQKAILAGYGIRVREDLQGNLMIEHLEQSRSLESEKYTVSQDKVGVSFKFAPKEGFAKVINGKATYSQSYDKNISDSYVVVDKASVFDQWMVHNKFVGLRQLEAIASGTFDVGKNGEITPSLGLTNTRYNDGSSNQTRVSGGLKYTHYMGDGKIYAEAQRS